MATTSSYSHFELLLKLQPWLSCVIELDGDPAATDRDGDASAVRERCRAVILAAQTAFRADKLLREKENDLTRTLVALLDEFGAKRFRRFNDWSSLQIELFHEAMLGDDVVLAMERLCAGRPREDPERSFVYYICLLLGFQGCYGDVNIQSDGERRLTALRLRLREALIEARWLSASRSDELSPTRPIPDGPPPPPAPPLWPWLLAFCVVLTVVTEYVALRYFAQQAGVEVERLLIHTPTQTRRDKA